MNAAAWPRLSYPDFAPTGHLLHMLLQALGKLKLSEPFHAQWAHVPLWPTARGLTTGTIAHGEGVYEVRADFLAHHVSWATSDGRSGQFALEAMSVADAVEQLLNGLREAGIDATIDLMPQEIPHPVRFDLDTETRPYDRSQAEAWWRTLVSVTRVLSRFQGRFTGKTQPIGLMWGTFDVRLPLYNGKPATPAPGCGYIRRNAMNAELMEIGWWPGDATFPKPAFYAFTYPQPAGIEHATIGPAPARWDAGMGEFLLEQDELIACDDPDAALLEFATSSYAAGASAAGWDPALLGTGRPD